MSVSKQEKDIGPFYGGTTHPLKPLGSVAFFLAKWFFYLSNDSASRDNNNRLGPEMNWLAEALEPSMSITVDVLDYAGGSVLITPGSLGFTKPDDKPIHTEEVRLCSFVEICSPGRFSFKMSESWVINEQDSAVP